jgi:hypothetical protein
MPYAKTRFPPKSATSVLYNNQIRPRALIAILLCGESHCVVHDGNSGAKTCSSPTLRSLGISINIVP